MRNRVLIEFVGLPGSGKTSVVKQMLEANSDYKHLWRFREEYRFKFFETIHRHFRALFFLIFNFPIALNIFKIVNKSKQLSKSNYRAVLVNLLYKRSYYKNIKDGVQVMDEGIIHALISLLISSKNKNLDFNDIESIFPNSKAFLWVVIHVNCDMDVLLERLRLRDNGQHRIFKYNLEEDVTRLNNSLLSILEFTENKTNASVFSVENIKLNVAVKDTELLIKEYLSQR